MKITAIVACDSEGGIGFKGKMPWHLPEELRLFRNSTFGKPIVMGRKTFESLGGKPLPGRMNCVLTSDKTLKCDGFYFFQDHSILIEFWKLAGAPELFVIGGAEIYKLFAPATNKLLITTIDHKFETDTRFPIEDFLHLKFNGDSTSSSYSDLDQSKPQLRWTRRTLDDKKPYVNA